MNNNKIRIGLAGHGTVGKACFELLQDLEHCQVVSVLVRDPGKNRCVLPSLLTCEVSEFLSSGPDVVIEALSDTATAYRIARLTLQQGKILISANKDLIASYGQELRALESRYGGTLLYEAACGAAVPVLRSIDSWFRYESRVALCAILNSTTNYILDKQQSDGLNFDAALSLAQRDGLAEANPAKDLSGRDAASKLSILLRHLYGTETEPEDLVYAGIGDWKLPNWLLKKVRLMAVAIPRGETEVVAYVLPALLPTDSHWLDVRKEQNAFEISGSSGERNFLKGNGAGGYATTTALVNDLLAALNGYRYTYQQAATRTLTNHYELEGLVVYDDWEKIPADFFLNEESRYSGKDLHFIEGRFCLDSLHGADWWKQAGVFLAVKAPEHTDFLEDKPIEERQGKAPTLINAF